MSLAYPTWRKQKEEEEKENDQTEDGQEPGP